MDPRLLRYYNRELQYVREMGAEFAREFPKIAGRLGLETFECADPYVERLLEGFAFMAARVQLKLDAEFPRFTQHLLEIVYPHYLSPTPSMAVVQLAPNLTEGSLADGFRVPRGTMMRSLLGRGDQTACEYRTGQDATLWPIEILKAEYGAFLADLGPVVAKSPGRPRAALRLRLRATAGLKFSSLSLDRLPIYLRSGDELAMRLYEQLLGRALCVLVRPVSGGANRPTDVLPRATRPLGFEDDEALLPYGARSFHGYRLLQEYFAFPGRFMFVELHGLNPALRKIAEPEVELVILTDGLDPTLENVVTTQHLALHCVPAVNLFPRRADRIHLTESQSEYHVVPDRTRPMDFEVYSVTGVTGFGTSADVKQEFHPFYSWDDRSGAEEHPAYYVVHRQSRMLSARQRAHGPRSSYVGSEVYVSLVDQDEGPYRPQLRQLAVETLCTNRDLPLHMTLGQGRTDFTLDSGAPVEAVRVVAGPTPPQPSHAYGDTTWRLVSHLSLNYLSITDGEGQGAAALREMLSLYSDVSEPTVRKQIDGVRAVSSRPITRRLPLPGPVTFGRGLEVTLTVDEAAFEGAGVYLLGAVLERFFAKYVSINGFTETVLRTVQRGEVMRWTPRIGGRHLV